MNADTVRNTTPQLRWDRADLASYYEFTRINLEPILDIVHFLANNLENYDSTCNCLKIDQLHDTIIAVFAEAAHLYVPHHRKNFYKFWWNQDMDLLKASSIDSNKLW